MHVEGSLLNLETPSQLISHTPEFTWLIPSWFARGVSVSWAGEQKVAGKSTLLRSMIRCVCTGEPFMGNRIENPGPVMYLTEETSYELKPSLIRSGLERLDNLYIQRWTNLPDYRWSDLCSEIAEAIDRLGVVWLVVDTLSQFTLGYGKNENDSAEQLGNMQEIQSISDRTGASVLLVRHTRKGSNGSSSAGSARGSSAISGAAGGLFTIHAPSDRGTERTIYYNGRIEDVPRKRTLDWDGRHYREVNCSWGPIAKQDSDLDQLLASVPATRAELKLALGTSSDSALTKVIDRAMLEGFIEVTGKGVRGDPKIYRKVDRVTPLSVLKR